MMVADPRDANRDTCRSNASLSLTPNTVRRRRLVCAAAGLRQTVAIMGFAFLVAWVVPTLGTIMGFTGAVMGTLSGFIFPAHWYLMLDDGTGPDTHPRTRAAAWATLVFGVVIGVVCFAAQVWSTINH